MRAQRTGQGWVYLTLSWSQACASFSHELAYPTIALCYGGSQPQFTVEETQASGGWGTARVTQLVSSRAPEPAFPTWYCPVPTAPAPQQALPLSPVSLCILLLSHLEHLLCFACLKLVYFCPYPSLKPLTPLFNCMSFNSPLEQSEICLELRTFLIPIITFACGSLFLNLG